MALPSGTRLGVYEIVSPLGAGGMGEVYRARDTRLGRDVAVKVLPDAVAADADRIARFEREAKVLASLNHPNIAALFGVDEGDGRHFLIMELVEGETLAERIAARRAQEQAGLPLDATLAISLQIAEGLEAAHEKGIVHRDLKPANVKITPDEKVKILDFGLAKAMETGSHVASVANSPTLSRMATEAGMILGTAAYMSPEQAKGYPADHRSDVFSFGVVLYEMLTGRQPFPGETAPDILASVLAREPDLRTLPADLNPRLLDLVRRCLDKTPKRRWQAIGDVRAELETIAAHPHAAPASAVQPDARPQSWRLRVMPIAVSAVVFAGVGGRPDDQTHQCQWRCSGHLMRSDPASWYELATAHFDLSNTGSLIYVPGLASTSGPGALALVDRQGNVESLKLPPGSYETPRVSPDGKRIAYSNAPGNEQAIFIHELSGSSSPRRLTFGGRNRFPVWSADGVRVAFQSDREGDPAVFWQRADGTDSAERLTKPDPGTSHIPESWSPSGDALLFSAFNDTFSSWTFSLRDRKAEPFGGVRSGNVPDAAFSPDGQWVAYRSSGSGPSAVFVQPFPPTGAKYQITSGASPVWSSDGKEILVVAPAGGELGRFSIGTRPSLTVGNRVVVRTPGMRIIDSALGTRGFDITPDGRILGVVTADAARPGTSTAPRIHVVVNWFEELKARVPAR